MAENFGSIRVSDGGGDVCHLPKGFLKIEGASGFQTPSEDSLELCLSQTGLAKNTKLNQTTSSLELMKPVLDTKIFTLEYY